MLIFFVIAWSGYCWFLAEALRKLRGVHSVSHMFTQNDKLKRRYQRFFKIMNDHKCKRYISMMVVTHTHTQHKTCWCWESLVATWKWFAIQWTRLETNLRKYNYFLWIILSHQTYWCHEHVFFRKLASADVFVNLKSDVAFS